MKRYSIMMVILNLGIFLFSANGFAQQDEKYGTGKFKDRWDKVDKFTKSDLPKSALAEVEEIYKLAKKENNPAQQTKAMLFIINYKSSIEDEGYKEIIGFIENEVKTAGFPARQLLQSVLAEAYTGFYNSNRYEINRRTTMTGIVPGDINTWDAITFAKKIIELYTSSVMPEERLKKIPVSFIDDIIEPGTMNRKIRPWLYDFLVNRAIDLYKDNGFDLPRPSEEFAIDGEKMLVSVGEFLKTELSTKDTLSFKYLALKNYSVLIRSHLADADSEAYEFADLERLEYIFNNTDFSIKKKSYYDILMGKQGKSTISSVKAECLYRIARLVYVGYRPDYSDDKIPLKKIAKETCEQVIENYPGTPGADKSKALKSEILAKYLNMSMESVLVSDKPEKFKVDYRNHSDFYIKLVRIDNAAREKLDDTWDQDKIYKILLSLPVVSSTEYKLPLPEDYESHSAELPLQALPYGRYALLVSAEKGFARKNNNIAYAYFQVSDLRLLTEDAGNRIKQRMWVVNGLTGSPVAGAKIEFFKHEYNKPKFRILEIKTDDGGFCEVDAPNIGYFNGDVVVSKDNDVFYWNNSWFGYRYSGTENDHYTTYFFTDRSIYRPGQTVYFKGVVVKSNPDRTKNEPEKNYKTSIVFFDPNVQELAHLDVQTNEYGSFSGSFVIPVSVLTGNFQLVESYGSSNISVEEYKRPKFEVTTNPVTNLYRLNEQVNISGTVKSYSGIPLTDAKVKYRVVRKAEWPYWDWWWMPRPSVPEKEILNGSLSAGADGKFSFSFKALADPDAALDIKPVFVYDIIINVTDINGETQSTTCTVKAGTVAVTGSIEINDYVMLKDKTSFKVRMENLNGIPVKISGKLIIKKVEQPDRPLREKLWAAPDQFVIEKAEYLKNYPYDPMTTKADVISKLPKTEVYTMELTSNTPVTLPPQVVSKFGQGTFEFIFQAKDTFGADITIKKQTVMIDQGSKENALNEFSYLVPVKTNVQPGEKAVFIWGSATDATAIIEIERRGLIIDTRKISVSKGQAVIEIPITEDDRGNISFNLATVNQNREYHYNKLITVPWNNKKLDLKLVTFRSNLQPGQKETWTLRISGPDKEKTTAEILAAMYDVSLDQFKPNNWHFNIYPDFNIDFSYRFPILYTQAWMSSLYENWYTYYNAKSWNYDRLKYSVYSGYYGWGYGNGIMKNLVVMEDATLADSVVSNAFDPGDINKLPAKYKKEAGEIPAYDDYDLSNQDQQKPQIRTNFNETAFFYPELKLNKDGDYSITFTSPEALTRWKLMLFAHTKDLKSGYLEDFATTSKKLMVTTNNPRFIRVGDELVYQVKLSNMADSVLSGTIELNLTDPYTLQAVNSKFDLVQNSLTFSLNAGESKNFQWPLKVPQETDMVTFQVVANSKTYSDGEENVIPILPDKILVTESLPLWIREGQAKKFTFDKLVNNKSVTLQNRSLTLEVSSNPAWYAVMALPYLIEYPNECSEQTFNRYYANLISMSLCKSDPRIRQVFESWKKSETSLVSPLEKNQELKSVLLNESPWVVDGKNETEQRQRIAQLFDENQLESSLAEAVMKLQQLQLYNGAWPWFKDMEENRFITQYIVTGFGHLRKMGINLTPDVEIMKMLRKAVSYLDKKITEDYNDLIRYKTRLDQENIGYEQIQYLYARSFFTEIEIPAEARKAFAYWKAQAEKYWTKKSLMTKAMSAIALQRFGNKQVSLKILASLKEYSTTTEEMGMYWKDNVSSWYWYQAPVETQALMIEAFSEITGDSVAVDNMRIWLLKQKQVQSWKTTKSTADACYALLKIGKGWLDSGKGLDIYLDDQKIDLQVPGAEAGTGYTKTRWTGSEIKAVMGNIRMEKKDKGIAWGALYWQYFEKLENITPAESPLKVEKEIFLLENTPQGPVLKKITENQNLKPGDVIKVRLVITSDRLMEFIHLKDMRAAALEPVETLSGYEYNGGLGYFKSIRDASVNYFFDRIPKGTYVLEYNLVINQEGVFQNGITTIQSMYAPEFSSHTAGGWIRSGK